MPEPTEDGDLVSKKYFDEHNNSMTGEATAITAIAEPASAQASDIATKVNEIIAALKARGVCL